MARVYRLYVGEEIKYVGFTTNMGVRMAMHFSLNDDYGNKVLTWEQTKDVTKIDYVETGMSNARVLEAFLIAMYKPEWNKEFVEDDELTYTLNTGTLEWKEYNLPKGDNPNHHILVWKGEELLYEIPKVHEVYDALCEHLGIEQNMEFGYNHAVYVGEYRLMRLSGKRHIQSGKQRQRAKLNFMGYPEKWAV